VYALIRNHTQVLRAHLEAVEPSARRGDGRRIPTAVSASRPKAPQQSAARQVSTLVRRHARIIAADPSYLAFMLLLPIIMGLLTKAISGDYGFTVPDLDLTMLTPAEVQEKHTNQALQLLVVLITGPVRVLVPVPVLSFALVLHAGAGCAPARGRRREFL